MVCNVNIVELTTFLTFSFPEHVKRRWKNGFTKRNFQFSLRAYEMVTESQQLWKWRNPLFALEVWQSDKNTETLDYRMNAEAHYFKFSPAMDFNPEKLIILFLWFQMSHNHCPRMCNEKKRWYA